MSRLSEVNRTEEESDKRGNETNKRERARIDMRYIQNEMKSIKIIQLYESRRKVYKPDPRVRLQVHLHLPT